MHRRVNAFFSLILLVNIFFYFGVFFSLRALAAAAAEDGARLITRVFLSLVLDDCVFDLRLCTIFFPLNRYGNFSFSNIGWNFSYFDK